MEGDEILGLLERAVVVVEDRQDKLKKLDEAIRLSSEPRRGQAIKPRIDLIGEINSSDAAAADRLHHLISSVNNQIERIDEMIDSLRHA
jgi:hypothetical protein